MLDAKLEQWINDFEAKFDIVKAKPYTPDELIHDLRYKSKVLGVEKLETKSGIEEIIYCYIPSSKLGLIHGYILKREDGKIGAMVSYGYISLENFKAEHTPFNPQKESKIKKYLMPTFIGTIIPITYIGLKKFFGKDKD